MGQPRPLFNLFSSFRCYLDGLIKTDRVANYNDFTTTCLVFSNRLFWFCLGTSYLINYSWDVMIFCFKFRNSSRHSNWFDIESGFGVGRLILSFEVWVDRQVSNRILKIQTIFCSPLFNFVKEYYLLMLIAPMLQKCLAPTYRHLREMDRSLAIIRGDRLTLTKYFCDQFSQVSLTKHGCKSTTN